VLNETTRIEFPSKKPVKELNSYNTFLTNFMAQSRLQTFEDQRSSSIFDFRPNS